MPELPEVETVRRGLQPAMEGARFLRVETRRPDLRFPLPERLAERLTGQTVAALSRRAKYLLVELASGDVLLMHLGMSGSFRITNNEEHRPGAFHHRRSADRAHDHVVFAMSSGALVTFNDPRRFGFMLLMPREELDRRPSIASLGPEPLADTFSAETLASACAGRKTSLKAALLDQRVVAGLGNIYVCEALHRAHLSPRRTASALADRKLRPTPRAETLAEAIKTVLGEAIEAGGSSLRDHRRTDGEIGYFQHHFRVYDREGERCPTAGCGGTIRRVVQAGRSTFFCPTCQK